MTAAPVLPIPRGPAGLRAHVAPPPPVDRYQRRIGSALTPQVVSSVLRAGDLGLLYPQADLLDEVRERDGHLQSVLGKREQAVAGAPWELRPAPGADKRKAKKVQRFCEDVLRGVRGLAAALAGLQSAVYHGRAGLEAILARDGRYWLPERFAAIHARRFAFHPTDWRLRFWDASAGPGSGSPFAAADYGVPVEDLQRLLPGKFIVHTPRVRGGYPQREGLGRTTVWYAGVFKAFGWRDFLAYAEQYGRPLRFGKFGTGKDPKLPQASPEDVDELEAALENLSSALVAVFPDTTEPVLQPPPGEGHTVHPELLRLCDEETSKAVVGGTLTTTGGTKGGNRALGDVHKEEELILFRGDAKALAETLRDQLLTPLVLLNGLGDRRDVPTVHFDVEPPDTLDQLAERFQTLTGAGLRIPAKHVRDRFEIPAPEGDEETIGGPPPAPVAPPATDAPPAPPKKPGKKPAPAQDDAA